MHLDDRRIDAWEASPGPIVLAVMALVVLAVLPFAVLFFLKDLFLPAEEAIAETRSKIATARPKQR
ncbi:hypothetical protein FV222_04560 [Methylobacterium sp. WL103]|uniref:hypothetical protein n=1 Tax=Methylobacterium sp. WL103 TaxID=2603891 RepID=UPI0011C82D7B|nr:hypothetical protein [Methylobacterium sp. WL103]TXN06770.1 hypothetical protein FV222_04560 [Methylobacterium sp. WL103]